MAEPRVLCTVLTDWTLPLPRSALKLGQLVDGEQLDGPVAGPTASIANGTHCRSTAGLLSLVSTPLDERAMSTQPRPGGAPGAMGAGRRVLVALFGSRRAAMPWPEPFGRA